MQRLALSSPPKKHKLDPAEQATNFLDRLKAVQLTDPESPRRPYVYGVLPFAVDWEVFRVDHYNSLDLDDAKAWQEEHLRPHAESPRIIWNRLCERAGQIAIADEGSVRMPKPTPDRVYQSLAEKGWTDGRVHLSLKMRIPDKGRIDYTVQPMKFSSSRRVYRRFGSDRFITVTIPNPEYQNHTDEVRRFLSEPLQICGRTYRVFFVKVAKENCSAHYFATEGAGLETPEMSRNSLMHWLISLERNKGRSAAKLWSRISLSLSSTTPSVVFDPKEIRSEFDIDSETKGCMTDGCAKASPAVFREIWRSGILGSKEMPTAIQGRIGGAKGVWYLDPRADIHSDEKWVEIRPSQLKYKYEETASHSDEMLRTLDICKASHSSFGEALNYQLIGILSHCGVPTRIFKDLLLEDLNKSLGVVNELLDQPIRLREWIADLGRIYSIRCHGADEYIDSQTGETASQEPGRIAYEQGVPKMKEEDCVKLLEAGFLPTSSRYLHDKLKFVISKACEKVSDKLHISIAKSSMLMCIADDLGVLEEDEVSIRFGKPFLDEETGRYVFYIQGDVLVARNPAYLPTDIQKIRAVECPKLEHLTDVIVFSTKGRKSKVSLLSGGDFDGDMIWTCWDERLVEPFQPAPLRFAEQPPNFLQEWFEKDSRTAHEVAPDGIMINAEKFITYGLETSLVPSDVGTCTHRHRDVVYKYSNFAHPDALTLAYLASNLVDAAKNGYRLRMDKYGKFLDSLRVSEPEYTKPKGTRRAFHLTHVMDVLVLDVIPAFQESVMVKFHQRVPTERSIPIDTDILGYYLRMKEKYPKLVEELRGELDRVRTLWKAYFAKYMNNRGQQKEDISCSPKKWARKVSYRAPSVELDSIYEDYQRITISGSDPFVEGNADFIKAAVAYCLDDGKFWGLDDPGNFAWNCGSYHALCKIKAEAVMRRTGTGVPARLIIEQMYIPLKTNSAFTRAEKER